MARTAWDGSLKWNIIYPCMEFIIIWANFIMVSSIWFRNVGNDGNGVEIHAKGMILGYSLFPIFMNSLTSRPTIWVV